MKGGRTSESEKGLKVRERGEKGGGRERRSER